MRLEIGIARGRRALYVAGRPAKASNVVAALHNHYGDGPEGYRLACTLAAAPKMLDALQAIRARIEGDWDHPALRDRGPLAVSTVDDIHQWTKAAIAEATGEEQPA
jgi:hypothetical protein